MRHYVTFSIFLCLLTTWTGQPLYGKNINLQKDLNIDIKGVIVDGQSGQPVANALVFARNLGLEVYTNAEGRFTLSGLVTGNINLVIIHEKYLIREYDLPAGQKDTRIELSPNTLDLETVVVVGTKGSGIPLHPLISTGKQSSIYRPPAYRKYYS